MNTTDNVVITCDHCGERFEGPEFDAELEFENHDCKECWDAKNFQSMLYQGRKLRHPRDVII